MKYKSNMMFVIFCIIISFLMIGFGIPYANPYMIAIGLSAVIASFLAGIHIIYLLVRYE